MNKYFLIYLIFSIIFVAGNVVVHEELHRETYDLFGCENIEVNYFEFLNTDNDAFARTTANCDLNSEERAAMLSAHQSVHNVHYLLIAVSFPLLIFLIILGLDINHKLIFLEKRYIENSEWSGYR